MEEEPTQVYGLDDQPTGVMDTGVMDPGDPNPTPNMTPTDVYEAVDLPTEARDFPDLEDADLVTTATQPLRPTGSRTSADGYRLIIGALKRVRLEERLAYLLAPILDAFYVNGRPVLVEPDALNLISDDVLDNLMGQPKAAFVGELQQLVNHLPLFDEQAVTEDQAEQLRVLASHIARELEKQHSIPAGSQPVPEAPRVVDPSVANQKPSPVPPKMTLKHRAYLVLLVLAAIVVAIALGLASGHPKAKINADTATTAPPVAAVTSPAPADPPATSTPATDPPTTVYVYVPPTDPPQQSVMSLTIKPEDYQRSGPHTYYASGGLDFRYDWVVDGPNGPITADYCHIFGQIFYANGQPLNGGSHSSCGGYWIAEDVPTGNSYHLVVTATTDAGSSKSASFDFTVTRTS